MHKYRLTINKANAASAQLLHVVNNVTSEKVRRITENGKEFVIVSSATLPDNVVMNRKLYPAEVIAATFESLERTHAPVEHPKNTNGEYISATDPEAYTNGYIVGAINVNVRRENGRVFLDKRIDVEQAMQTDRGKRLLDRIKMLEEGKIDNIQTSTGIYTLGNKLDAMQIDANGDEYDYIVDDMVFDHDAILLDSIAAATPDKGVGIGVNSNLIARINGEEISVNEFVLSALSDAVRGEDNQDTDEDAKVQSVTNTIMGAVRSLFPKGLKVANASTECNNTQDEAETSAQIETNNEGDAMREAMIAALKAKGIQVNSDIPDTDLLDKYNQSLTANAQGDTDKETNAKDEDEAANAKEDDAYNAERDDKVMNALDKLNKRLDGMEKKLSANEDSERASLVSQLESADVGLDADDMKEMSVNALQKLHTKHCGTTQGLYLATNSGRQTDDLDKLDY